MNVELGRDLLGRSTTNLAGLPMGQPNVMPLLGVIANKTLWPMWALISLAGAIFPFLLCPVYINFISRMQLAWSLDRQLPEWFGEVNERMRAPLNAILATLGLTALFLFFQSYNALPPLPRDDRQQAEPGRHALVLDHHGRADVDRCPGVNAILVRFRRPDLMRNAPFAEGAAVARAGLARLPGVDLLVRGSSSRSGTASPRPGGRS